MSVELPKEWQEFVEQEVSEGGYANTAEVVVEALREFRASRIDPEENSPELEAWLLEAQGSPESPWRREEVTEILARLRAKHASQ